MQFAIPLGFLFALTPWCSSALALALGVAIALSLGNPYQARTKKYVKPLLSTAIIGLGFGMNLGVILQAGMNGVLFTAVSLAVTILVGYGLGKILKTAPAISALLNVGTAICGGSAIAAASTAIRARDDETSISLAVVFLLNAVGLIIFPPLGRMFGLDESQFGVWAALAIHDTSSVVGAAAQYGPHALEVGTTVKLVRALWIIPVTFMIAKVYVSKDTDGARAKPAFPYFIIGFLLAAALVTWLPVLQGPGHWLEYAARRLLTATLFLIGAGMTRQTLKNVGLNPLVHGVLLWIFVASASLAAVKFTLAN